MRTVLRLPAASLALALALTACGGHGSSPPATGGGSTTEAAARTAVAPAAPLVSIPTTSGALAFTDAGRRAAQIADQDAALAIMRGGLADPLGAAAEAIIRRLTNDQPRVSSGT